MVVGVAAVKLEVGAKLLIHALGVVLEKGARLRRPRVIAHRAGAAQRSGLIGWNPGVHADDFGRNRIEAASGDDIARKRIAGPGAIRELPRSERVENRNGYAAEGKIATQLIGRRGLAGKRRRLLFDQLLVSKEEE